jgi:disulfide bond formation protein DsbB
MLNFIKKNALYIIFAQALVAMLGSLFASEVAGFAPCVLCWYARIAMYPIVVLSIVGIVRKDINVGYYIAPFSIIGLVISGFHNLLYWSIIPEAVGPCVAGVSCTTKYIEWFGFITIPFLTFVAFGVITIGAILFIKHNKQNA